MSRILSLNGMFGVGALPPRPSFDPSINLDAIFAAARRGLIDGSQGMSMDQYNWLKTYAATAEGQSHLSANPDVVQSMQKFESYLQRLGVKTAMTPEQLSASRSSGGLLDSLKSLLASGTAAFTPQPAAQIRGGRDSDGSGAMLLLGALVLGGGGLYLYSKNKKPGRRRR